MQVNADWMAKYSAKTFAEEFRRPFTGPGFYLDPMDFLLVVPLIDLPPGDRGYWKQTWPEDQVFMVYVYNCPMAESVFNNMPTTRVDNRP
jgi:hypothetical protein